MKMTFCRLLSHVHFLVFRHGILDEPVVIVEKVPSFKAVQHHWCHHSVTSHLFVLFLKQQTENIAGFDPDLRRMWNHKQRKEMGPKTQDRIAILKSQGGGEGRGITMRKTTTAARFLADFN